MNRQMKMAVNGIRVADAASGASWSRTMGLALLVLVAASLGYPSEVVAGTYEIVLKKSSADVLESGKELARLYGLTIHSQVGSVLVAEGSDASAGGLAADPRVERLTLQDDGTYEEPSLPIESPPAAQNTRRRAAASPPSPASASAGLSRYVMVLEHPSYGEVPDVEKLGGKRTKHEWKNRRVIEIPEQAVEALRQNPRVRYLQKLMPPGQPGARTLSAGGSREFASTASVSGAPITDTSITPAAWNSGEYRYDGAGNIINIGEDYYIYDGLGRLVQATVTSGGTRDTEWYQYDPFGNLVSRKSTVGSGSELPISVDPSTNRMNGVPYDHAGNILALDNWHYQWGPFNTMNELAGGGGHQDLYIYSASDERIGTRSGGSYWRWTIRDLSGKVQREYESYDDPGAGWMWIEDYVYRGSSLAGAEREAEEGGRRHFVLDHLGTPRMITNQSGQAISRHDYTPFGLEVSSMLQERARGYERVEPMKFTGHERDFNGGTYSENTDYLDYMHARYYRPTVGRFLSVDPAWESADVTRPQSWNRYAYVENNPMNKIDPDGRNPLGALIGGAIGVSVESYKQVTSGRPVDNRRLRAALAGGAVAGATGGLGGASVRAAFRFGALGGVLGGATERGINKGENIVSTAIVTDAVTGAAGGAAGQRLGQAMVRASQSSGTLNQLAIQGAAQRGEAAAANAGLGADRETARQANTLVRGITGGGDVAGNIAGEVIRNEIKQVKDELEKKHQ